MPVVHLVGICGFCLDEPGACYHPECPRGPTPDPLGPSALAQSAPRPPTRPSVAGGPAAAVVPVTTASQAPARPVPHLATAPSVTTRAR